MLVELTDMKIFIYKDNMTFTAKKCVLFTPNTVLTCRILYEIVTLSYKNDYVLMQIIFDSLNFLIQLLTKILTLSYQIFYSYNQMIMNINIILSKPVLKFVFQKQKVKIV